MPSALRKEREYLFFKNFIYGAAPLAPLLFPNLMVLGLIALWRLRAFAAE